MISVPIYISGKYDCSYFDGNIAESVAVDPGFPLDTVIYSGLIEQGFRRSGDQVYRPHCQQCQACIPTRIPVKDFQADRKQRRCQKRNTQTDVQIKPARFDSRHFDLYQRYQAARHDQSYADKITPQEYMQFLGSSWCNTLFVEYSIAGKLAAIAVVDVLDQALSAVYTFFDPEFADYSPGVYAVLWQINLAREQNFDYVYLGFWIKNCRKMQYKNQYQPLQGFIDQQWQAIF